jgi:hypothetical protein
MCNDSKKVLASEAAVILRAVESSRLPTKEAILSVYVPSSTLYKWKSAFDKQEIEGLRDRSLSRERR